MQTVIQLVSNTQDNVEQTSDSNIYIPWTAGALNGTQKPEPTTERSVIKQSEFSEPTTTIAHTTTGSSFPFPDASSATSHSSATTTQHRMTQPILK